MLLSLLHKRPLLSSLPAHASARSALFCYGLFLARGLGNRGTMHVYHHELVSYVKYIKDTSLPRKASTANVLVQLVFQC